MEMNFDTPEIALTTGEIARRLNVSRDHVQRIIDTRRIVEEQRAGTTRIFGKKQIEEIKVHIDEQRRMRGEKP